MSFTIRTKGYRMSKQTLVWLIALILLSVVSAQYDEAMLIREQSPSFSTAVASISLSSSPSSDIADQNSIPLAPRVMTLSSQANDIEEPCWIRPFEYQQNSSIAGARPGGKPGVIVSRPKFRKHAYGASTTLVQSTGSLSALSSPNITLRL